MPAKNPNTTQQALQHLQALGELIRAQRKALKVSAVAAAESASMSRITWHRIEKGEPSVTAGAYANALEVLGLVVSATTATTQTTENDVGMIPAIISLAHYPQLQQLAWHVKGTDTLSAREAFDIYERNARHLEQAKLTDQERQLITALQTGFAHHAG